MAAKKNERTAVTARGVALLGLIAASESGYLMLTQDEGLEAVNAGHAAVDGSITDGDTAAVRLTDAGRAALAAAEQAASGAGQGGGQAEGQAGGAAAGTAAAGNGGFVIEDSVPLPASSNRGRSGGYPFEALQVGQSFHVPLGKDDKTAADVATRLQSSVSGARTRFAEKTGETETVEVKVYARDAAGKYIKGEDGKRVVSGKNNVTRDKLKVTRDFTVKAVDATDPRGPGARVWRTA